MDRAVALVNIMCYILDCSIDYIDSDSNFSDGISRELQSDTWAAKHAISTKVMSTAAWWWTASLQELWSSLEGGENQHVAVVSCLSL